MGYTYTPDTLNRQSVNDNGAVTTYEPTALNQYRSLNGGMCHYDNNFNLREGPDWWGTFDASSRLTSAGHSGNVVYFTYDGLAAVCGGWSIRPAAGAAP